mmetsp:Transcript_73428/g.129573  ORF Transcript_73428/g.129573 Transcript_73428/m.129573 type:complete len:125 (-) Transcript_73428:33-407(-)
MAMAGQGLVSSGSMPSLSISDSNAAAAYMIPSCYSSHKAMSKTFVKAPGLFSAGGMRLGGEMEKYRTADQRNASATSTAYLRRQMLLPEVDNLKKSFSNDIWRGRQPVPKWSGEKLEVIHKDMR